MSEISKKKQQERVAIAVIIRIVLFLLIVGPVVLIKETRYSEGGAIISGAALISLTLTFRKYFE